MMNKNAPKSPTTPTTSVVITDPTTATTAPVSSLRPGIAKPFSVAELQARSHGQNYFQLAKNYRDSNDLLNAVSCCLEGLVLTFGISRPLAVRDQLQDLLDSLDPFGTVSYQLRMCTDNMRPQCSNHVLTADQTRCVAPKYLEHLVSAHQLLTYPSEYRRFNRAFEDARACLKQNPTVCELYIVQYRTQFTDLRHGGELHFSFVPAALISRNGPYCLTDICAVLRN